MRVALVALVLFATGCPPSADLRCNDDADCKNFTTCIDGSCTHAGGEGEGDVVGEGEGDVVGEGEGDVGEGEGEGGEGEGEGHANAAPSVAPASLRAIGTTSVAFDASTSDPDGDDVTVQLGQSAAHGSVVVVGPARVAYTCSDATFDGVDTFTIVPVDSHGLAGVEATVTVRVLPSDWIDAALLSRVRVDVIAAPVSSVVKRLPALIVLHDAAFIASARSMVRFVDANAQLLDAELDHDDGTTQAWWVLLPTIDAANGDHIYVYAGGSTTLPASDPTKVFGDYDAVYHLEADLADATGRHPPGALLGDATSTTCAVGACVAVAGAGRVDIGDSLSDVAGLAALTLSASAAPQTLTQTSDVVSYSAGANNGVSRVNIGFDSGRHGAAGVRVDDAGTQIFFGGGPAIAIGVTAQVDAVMDLNVGTLTIYVDGVKVASQQVPTGALTNAPDAAALGATPNGSFAFRGTLDEVRAAPVLRSDDFILLDARSRADALFAVGPVEQ